jgi:hypothetical protein
MLHRLDRLTRFVDVLAGRLVPHQGFAGVRVVTLGQPLELILPDLSAESLFVREPSLPLAANNVVLVVVGLFGAGELLSVIRLGLACTQWFGDGQQGEICPGASGVPPFSPRSSEPDGATS